MKLDLTKIEGYENMTPEEKLKALEGYDVPDPDYSGYVKKDRLGHLYSTDSEVVYRSHAVGETAQSHFLCVRSAPGKYPAVDS